MKNNDKELTKTQIIADKANKFLQKHAKTLIIILAVVVVLLIGFCIYYAVANNKLQDSYTELYRLEESYSDLLSMDNTTDEYADALTTFEDEVNAYLSGNKISTYQGSKATMLLAQVAYMEENWQSAYDLFMAVAEENSDNYLGSLNYANAAAAAENNGNTTEALRLYTKIWDDYGTSASEAPKALFNQARLEEEAGNTEIAKSIYEQLVGQFANSYYTAIAQAKLLTF